MAIGADDAQPVQHVALPPVTFGWFFKRALIGIAILMVAMGGLAWLTHASIDPDEEDLAPTAAALSSDRASGAAPLDR